MAIQERRAPLTERQVENMMAVLVRKESAFLTARRNLGADDFAEHHRAYAAVWSVVCDHYDEVSDLPSEDEMLGEVERRISEDPEFLSEEEGALLDEFAHRAYQIDPDALKTSTVRTAFKYLRRYLEERLVSEIRSDVMHSTYAPTNMCGLLEGYRDRAARVQTIEPTGLQEPFPKGWTQQSPQESKQKTQLEFLDLMLQGGQLPKEVYGILGPTGSCKTTIALQYATRQAAHWAKLYRRGEIDVLKHVYVFVYESDIEEMRLRALSSFGQIDRNVLETRDWRLLSKPGQLKRYERKLFAEMIRAGGRPLCERERFVKAQSRLNLNLRIIDMTGNDPHHPNRGWGLIDEIQQIIQADQDHHQEAGVNSAVGPVVIDYAGAAVERYLDATGKDHSREKVHLLGGFGMQCKNKLAIKFRTQVLVLHQLSGVANSFGPGRVPKSSDAMGCKTYSHNLDFSFCVGMPTEGEIRQAVFVCDKHRRAPGMGSVVIRVNGMLSEVRLDRHHVLDPVGGRIVPRSEMHSIDDGDDGPGFPPDDYLGADIQTQQISERLSDRP